MVVERREGKWGDFWTLDRSGFKYVGSCGATLTGGAGDRESRESREREGVKNRLQTECLDPSTPQRTSKSSQVGQSRKWYQKRSEVLM